MSYKKIIQHLLRNENVTKNKKIIEKTNSSCFDKQNKHVTSLSFQIYLAKRYEIR